MRRTRQTRTTGRSRVGAAGPLDPWVLAAMMLSARRGATGSAEAAEVADRIAMLIGDRAEESASAGSEEWRYEVGMACVA